MTMSALTVEEKNDPFIKHALKIRSAWSLSNYHSFFQLYSVAPNMGGYLLDLFVQRERQRAIKTLIKSWVISLMLFKSVLHSATFAMRLFNACSKETKHQDSFTYFKIHIHIHIDML